MIDRKPPGFRPRKPRQRRCYPPPVPRTTRSALCLGLATCWLALSCAHAAPEGSPAPGQADPVLELLAERQLLGPLDPAPLVRSVRDKTSDLVISAMNFIGVPYRRGGNSETSGFDCSGFTRHVFELSLGLVLPRRADEQASASGLQAVERDALQPGDLVFFNTMRRTFSHVGIYLGEGRFIHSPRSGSEVRIESMRDRYWEQRFTGARRADLGTAR